jgi:radical SAM superfamily enzyme YgiQ (UPF0313 family)
MNILLIEINTFIPPAVPISLAYIAAYAKSKGFPVRLISIGEGTPFSLRHLQQTLDEYRPRLVGFSTYQRNIPFVLGLAKTIKEHDPAIKTIIGGPQATFIPEKALERTSVDFICREEGERALVNLAEMIRDGSEPLLPKGCSCKMEDGTFCRGASFQGSCDLDDYPSPYLSDDLIDLGTIDEAIMLTSRGCPYQCIFCYTPNAFKRQVCFHSVERVVEEMAWINKKGINKFWFADPSFSINMERVDQLIEQILRTHIKGEIWLETRADLIDEQLLKKMKAAGVRQVAYGLESASENVLCHLKKNISLDHVRRAIRLSQKQGMEVELFSQYGLPYETFEDAMLTLQFVKDNDVPVQGNTNSQQTQIYFGTDLFDNYEMWGILPLEKQAPRYISIGDQYETTCLCAEEIRKIKSIWESESLDGGKRKVS